MTSTCAVCSGPYLAVSDDPSPAHPGCAPSDPTRFEAATRGPRTYTGRVPALVWSVCAGCSRRIEVGDEQVLTVIDGRRVWACAACSVQSVSFPRETAVPPIALDDARESRRDALRAGNDHESATRRSA